MHADPHTHHDRRVHRERRFHRPRQSLGFGFYAFDVVPLLPSASHPATPELEVVSEIEKHHSATRKVLRICAAILVCTYWVYTAAQNTAVWRAWIERLQTWPGQ